MIKDQLLVYDDISILRTKCPSCLKPVSNHLIPKCSLLSHCPNSVGVIQKYMHRNQQKREIFTRNHIRLKTKTLTHKESIQKAQKMFVEMNESRILRLSKGRRCNVYDVHSFLNNNTSLKPANSLPLSEEEEENGESWDESEIRDDFTPKVN